MGPHSSCALGWPEARWGLAVLSTEGAQRRPGVLALNWALFSTEGGKETGKGDAFSPWRSTLVNACRTLWLFRRSVVSDSLRPHGLQHARPPCPSPAPRACTDSCPSSRWCQPTISSSVISFSSCLQSFPASGSFPMSQFFASGGQSIGASAAEFLCMGRCKSLGSLWSFLSYASQLPGASISHFFHSLSSSVFTTGSGFSLAAAR